MDKLLQCGRELHDKVMEMSNHPERLDWAVLNRITSFGWIQWLTDGKLALSSFLSEVEVRLSNRTVYNYKVSTLPSLCGESLFIHSTVLLSSIQDHSNKKTQDIKLKSQHEIHTPRYLPLCCCWPPRTSRRCRPRAFRRRWTSTSHWGWVRQHNQATILQQVRQWQEDPWILPKWLLPELQVRLLGQLVSVFSNSQFTVWKIDPNFKLYKVTSWSHVNANLALLGNHQVSRNRPSFVRDGKAFVPK